MSVKNFIESIIDHSDDNPFVLWVIITIIGFIPILGVLGIVGIACYLFGFIGLFAIPIIILVGMFATMIGLSIAKAMGIKGTEDLRLD
jgi:hypothetical protein